MDSIIYGDRWGIFLDDTGGEPIPGRHPQRCTWVAVIIPPGKTVMFENLYGVVNATRKKFGVDRIHFKELYGGKKGGYEGLSLDLRLSALSLFVDMVLTHHLAIIAVQMDPDVVADEVSRRKAPTPRHLPKPNAFRTAHFRAIDCAVRMIRTYDSTVSVAAFSDRWTRGADIVNRGAAPGTPKRSLYEGVLDPPLIIYKNSADLPALQLADFAAWSFNRLEQLFSLSLIKKPLDVKTLPVLAPLASVTHWWSPYPSDVVQFPYHRIDADWPQKFLN
jgi:hypothetical protein